MIWMMGQSVPSASLQVTPSWEEWLTCQRVELPSKETSKAGEMGHLKPHEVQQAEV